MNLDNCDQDSILYHVAALPEKYRIEEWDAGRLVSDADFQDLPEDFQNVVLYLCGEKSEEELTRYENSLRIGIESWIRRERELADERRDLW